VLSDENSQRYYKALFPVALLLILVPLVDLVLRVSPPQLGSLQWRFTAVGLLLGNYGTIILGLALFGLASVLTGSRGRLRAVGYVGVVTSVVTLAIVVLFLLDAVQMRQVVNANAKRLVLTAGLGAMVTAVLGAIALLALGRGALAASRGGPVAAAPRRPVASPLVVAGHSAGDSV
jgi:hypothetical protein